MSPAKVADLRARFPFIDVGCKLDFGDGWFKLVAGFCGAAKFWMDDTFRITQMESHNGELKIRYVGRGGCEMDKMVARAELRSTMTCEHCGLLATQRTVRGFGMWWVRGRERRICPACRDLYQTLPKSSRDIVFQL